MAQVLIIPAWYPWPDAPIRGIWAIDQALVAARRHEVVVLTYRPEEGSRRPYELHEETREHGLRTIRFTYPPPRAPGLGLVSASRAARAAASRLEATGFTPDLVHANVFLAGVPALAVARRYGAPMLVNEYLSRFCSGEVSRAELMLARRTFARADLVCPCSEALGRALRDYGVRAPMQPMPIAVDMSVFAAKAAERRPADRSGSRPRFATVGGLDPKKGHAVLLEAISLCRDRGVELELDLVGGGPLHDELERRARSLGLAEVVRLHGHQPKPEIAEILARSDFFVLSSLRESAGAVLIEALAAGLPCVTTDTGGAPEIVGEDGLVVPPGDAAALAEAISRMASDYTRYDPQALSDRAVATFGYDAMEARWDEVYRSLLRRRRRRSPPSRAAAAGPG